LSLAFIIFGTAVWLARELAVKEGRTRVPDPARRLMRRGLATVGIVFALQVVWGAFVAGLKAGRYHNTFPLMEGRLVPPSLYWLEPAALNFVQNPVAVQWMHRLLGTVLGLVVIGVYFQIRQNEVDRHSRRLNASFLVGMLAQYLLGVLTLIYVVPLSLAVLHQATAMILFGIWVWWWHHVRELEPAVG
ncbi:MAG: COX15/CtaA family protein, partial [Gemmatimonadota bacterium]